MSQSRNLLSKAFSRDGQQTKQDISDILFFAKEVLGVIIGVIVAILGLTGIIGFIAYAIAASILVYIYVFKFLGVDEEVVESKDVLKDHFMNGFIPFVLTWVVAYNLINF